MLWGVGALGALCRYRDDGRIEMDNNAVERASRCLALGRKKYLFAGGDAGGERAAAIYSLIGSAKLNGLDPEASTHNCSTKACISARSAPCTASFGQTPKCLSGDGLRVIQSTKSPSSLRPHRDKYSHGTLRNSAAQRKAFGIRCL
jgi:hypothetical protein